MLHTGCTPWRCSSPRCSACPAGRRSPERYSRPRWERYGAGDRVGAVDTFLRGVAGPDYRAVLEKAVPGAFDQAVADADAFFGQELPALRQWSFTRAEARGIAQPVLAVLGARSDDVRPSRSGASRVFRERQELLLDWLPNVEPFILRDATHLLQVENPRGMAEGLAAFFARHPLPAGLG